MTTPEPPEEIRNRVEDSGIVSLDLEALYPKGERVVYDLKDNLFQGLILREKEFRVFCKEHNWKQYQGKFVAVTCSEEAIIPTWAYMLFVSYASGHAKRVVVGDAADLEQALFQEVVAGLNPADYDGVRLVVKGCSELPVPASAYGELVSRLQPVVKSLMFGEPCSTVPVYKAPK